MNRVADWDLVSRPVTAKRHRIPRQRPRLGQRPVRVSGLPNAATFPARLRLTWLPECQSSVKPRWRSGPG